MKTPIEFAVMIMAAARLKEEPEYMTATEIKLREQVMDKLINELTKRDASFVVEGPPDAEVEDRATLEARFLARRIKSTPVEDLLAMAFFGGAEYFRANARVAPAPEPSEVWPKTILWNTQANRPAKPGDDLGVVATGTNGGSGNGGPSSPLGNSKGFKSYFLHPKEKTNENSLRQILRRLFKRAR